MKTKVFYALAAVFLLFISHDVLSQDMDKHYKKFLKEANKEKKKGNYLFAKDRYEMVIAKYPGHLESLLGCADIEYEHKNNFKDALAHYKQALKVINQNIEQLSFAIKRKEKKALAKEKERKHSIENKIHSCKSYLGQEDDKNSGRREKMLDKVSPKIAEPERNPYNESADDTRGSNSSDYSGINESAFLTPFFPVNSKDKTRQVVQIVDVVEKTYDDLKNDNDSKQHSYSDIIKINNTWFSKIRYSQLTWFERLKDFEEYYRDRLEEYNGIEREKLKRENEKAIKINLIKGLEAKKAIDEEENRNLNNILNIVLKEELKSKLATIPKSIVLVGRIKHTEAGEDVFSKVLMDEMMQKAVKQVNGYQILNELYSTEGSVSQLYEITFDGIAQITDKFYRPMKKSFKDEMRTYKICRLDVFPFNEKEVGSVQPKETIKGDEVLYDTDVYEIKEDYNKLRELPNYEETSLQDHKFKEDEIEFIKTLNQFSNDLTDDYTKKIQEAVSQYKSKLQTTQDKLTISSSIYKELLIDLEQEKQELENVEQKIKQLDTSLINNYENEYKSAMLDYEEFYITKMQYVNQLHVLNTYDWGKTHKEGFKNLAEKCYNAIDKNLSKKYAKNTIFKEVNKGNKVLGLEEYTINYTYEIDSFRIISLDKYQAGDDDYMSLNLAFAIKWVCQKEGCLPTENNPILTNTQRPSTETDAENEDLPRLENTPTGGSGNNNTELASSLTPKRSEREAVLKKWKCFEAQKPTSLRMYRLRYAEGSWTIPNKTELKRIIQNSDNQPKINKSLFGTQAWPPDEDEIVVVASDLEINPYDNRTYYKAFTIGKNWSSIEETGVSEGDIVYIILVEK
jgi:hypothetical protein